MEGDSPLQADGPMEDDISSVEAGGPLRGDVLSVVMSPGRVVFFGVPLHPPQGAAVPPGFPSPQHIVGCLGTLGAAWHLELDAFEAVTPRGPVTFTNVVATVAPAPPRRLPLLLFLDGEEAFGDWSVTDSLYGARHLAARMAASPHGPRGTQITAMSLLVLLDLLGARHPATPSHFSRTHHWFLRLVAIEQRLQRLGLLRAPPQDQPFFRLSPAPGPVEDDHVPFLQRGVPVLHLIPMPFPRVWHTLEDTEDNLHPPTVEDLCKILVAFVAEFLQL
ncbi:PREDICTED: glutaminyl-peptide cyclotransferase-like protein [Nipponia nippon]|uniref:glutaminyl-peptide cyclotransferase-like protein n=1 Tax=Nipponia nippon TaxID=128390 RepID=UPI00051091F9|nr:PREDICTED: glutaminyl-peptide cyclotransferase-like protein [Nipponia nippon]